MKDQDIYLYHYEKMIGIHGPDQLFYLLLNRL